ncbi:hypothetical protein NPIL_673401 [Nephila pilipes]|uniref:Uncharacterized protein n=1 Tax=Nephila pilipes TaxID=299642 RepID=A0A8X6TLD8_NEPPI|nr:hypothetical protein NPIL_673401 [Nephila pilipes]
MVFGYASTNRLNPLLKKVCSAANHFETCYLRLITEEPQPDNCPLLVRGEVEMSNNPSFVQERIAFDSMRIVVQT